jgi:hypothetical protein
VWILRHLGTYVPTYLLVPEVLYPAGCRVIDWLWGLSPIPEAARPSFAPRSPPGSRLSAPPIPGSEWSGPPPAYQLTRPGLIARLDPPFHQRPDSLDKYLHFLSLHVCSLKQCPTINTLACHPLNSKSHCIIFYRSSPAREDCIAISLPRCRQPRDWPTPELPRRTAGGPISLCSSERGSTSPSRWRRTRRLLPRPLQGFNSQICPRRYRRKSSVM